MSIDTRKINKDEMYFSLKGDNFDGNVFAMEAIEKGAKFSIVDDLEQKDIHDNVVINGQLVFCELTPIIEKTFKIMGLTKYCAVYATQDEAISALS